MKLRRNDLLLIAVALLIPILAYFTLFKSRIQTLRQLRQEEAPLKQQADDSVSYGRFSLLRTDVRNLTKQLDAFFAPVPTADHALTGVESVLNHAQQCGLKIDLFQPGKADEENGLGILSVQLVAHAQFNQLYDFLGRVEQDKSIITVERLEIETIPPADDCTVKLELRIHFVKPTQEKPA